MSTHRPPPDGSNDSAGPSDHELLQWIRSARDGDKDALDRVLGATEARVRMMVAVRLPLRIAEQRREDVVQEVLVGIAGGLEGLVLNGIGEWNAWVSRVAANKCVDSFRREKRRVDGSIDGAFPAEPDVSSLPAIWTLIASSGPSPSSVAARREALVILMEELRLMSEEHREVVILAFVDGLNTAEIGKRVGIARTAAANRVVRARLELERRWRRRTGQS